MRCPLRFCKLLATDQPEWTDLVATVLNRAPGGEKCALMVWAPCRKKYQLVWPCDLDKAKIRLEDIVSGGGRWERVPMPQLW